MEAKYDKLSKGFDLLAPFYDVLCLCSSGKVLSNSQRTFLGELLSCKRALLIGGGTGGFLVDLLDACPELEIVSLDISFQMHEQSKAKILKLGADIRRVEFVQGSIEQFSFCNEFDLVITNYYLDLYTTSELSEKVKFINKALTQNALWLFTDFNDQVLGMRKHLFRIVIGALYLPFRLLTGIETKRLPDFETVFGEYPLEQTKVQYYLFGLLQAKLFKKIY